MVPAGRVSPRAAEKTDNVEPARGFAATVTISGPMGAFSAPLGQCKFKLNTEGLRIYG